MLAGNFFMSPNGDSRRLKAAPPGLAFLLRRLGRRVPDRGVVHDAVMLAQRGHQILVEERGGRFRVVIIDRRKERGDLQVLARLPGGNLVFARR
jgi:hypothetical protein